MDFNDIINEFHLNLDKYINSLQDEEQRKIIALNHQDMYNYSSDKAADLTKFINDSNKQILQILKEYHNNIDIIQDKNTNAKNMYQQVLRYNLDSINDNLITKTKDIEQENESINNQDFKLIAKNRDLLNNIDIDKNLVNSGYSSYSPDIVKNYNQTKDNIARNCNNNNNINHAKISKEIYIINDMHTKELEKLSNEIEATKQSILNLTDEIVSRKNRNDGVIYKKEVELNQKINKISAQYNEKKKLNDIQSKIELDSLKTNISSITEKYNKEKQKLSLELQEQFQIIDDQIDKITSDYKIKIEKFQKEKALDRFYKEKKYNEAIKNIQQSSKTLSLKKGVRKKMKKEYNIFVTFDKNIQNTLDFYESEFKRNVSYLKSKKYLLDAHRKYKSSIIDLDEDYEKYIVNLEIENLKNDNMRYNSKLDNYLSIDVNNERLAFDINKEKIDNTFQIWENIRNQSMSILKLKSANQAVDKKQCIEVNKLINDLHRKIDENKRKLNDLEAILIVEKNKYLVKFNNEIINNKILYCNNNHNFQKANITSLFEKRQNILFEQRQFNESSKNYFIKHSELIKQQESTNYLNNIEKAANEEELSRAKEKNKLQIAKLKIDKYLLEKVFTNIYDIEMYYQNKILDIVNSTSVYLLNHLTNCEGLVKILNNIVNEFIEFNILLNENILSLMSKFINSRISFEVGNKFDKEISMINEKYNNELIVLNDYSSKINITLNNYNKQINDIYSKLASNTEMFKEVDSSERKRIKNDSKELTKLSGKILKLSANLNNTKNKIEYKHKRIEALRTIELDRINTIKNAEFMINNQAIIKTNMLVERVNNNLYDLINLFKFDNLVIYKSFENNNNLLKKTLSDNFNYFHTRMIAILNDFYLNESNSIALSYKNEIDRNISLETTRNKKYDKNIHTLEQKIIANNETYRYDSIRHTDRIKDINNYYLEKLNINKQNLINANLEAYSSIKSKKQIFYDIFNACDQNCNHIISSLISENNMMKKAYAMNLNMISKKYEQEKSNNQKKQEEYVLKLKKEKNLLAKMAKQKELEIKDEYKQKNIVLTQKNISYDVDSVRQNKKKLELIEGYQKNIKKLKEKEKNNYQTEKKLIERKNK